MKDKYWVKNTSLKKKKKLRKRSITKAIQADFKIVTGREDIMQKDTDILLYIK